MQQFADVFALILRTMERAMAPGAGWMEFAALFGFVVAGVVIIMVITGLFF